MGLQWPGNAAFSGDGPLVTYKMVEVVAARHSGASEHNDLVIATDQAETLFDYLSEVIDCWEMKWEPALLVVAETEISSHSRRRLSLEIQ